MESSFGSPAQLSARGGCSPLSLRSPRARQRRPSAGGLGDSAPAQEGALFLALDSPNGRQEGLRGYPERGNGQGASGLTRLTQTPGTS